MAKDTDSIEHDIQTLEEEEKKIVEPKPPSASKQRLDHIRATLIKQKASSPEVFENEQSPQYAALAWLTNEDERQLDPESVYLTQRYGLVVLWLSVFRQHPHVDEDDATIVPQLDLSAAINGATFTEDYVFDDESGGGSGGNLRRRRRHLSDNNTPEDASSTNNNDNHSNGWFRDSNWLTSSGVCAWEGISCHPHDKDGTDINNPNNDGDVSHVELRRNNLQGILPDEIYTTLPYLNVLDLSDNGLAGTLSDAIGSNHHWSSSLQVLNLTSNNFSGRITPSIGNLKSLKELHLANNRLEKNIPHSIGGSSMTHLKHLDLSSNSIQGTIPYELGSLSTLSSLNLSWNLLVGELPHELSNLQTLVELDVSHNNLGGPLISELSSTMFLTKLKLNDNHFSGEVPREIGDLLHLDELWLNNNNFQSTLPSEISKLEGLGKIYYDGCVFLCFLEDELSY